MKHHAKSIGSADPQHSSGKRLQRRAGLPVIVIYQFYRDLCIRLGVKRIAGLQKFVFQLLVIFNDSIVYQYNRPVLRAVGMRVILRRLPVRRPPGVADSAGSRNRHTAVCLFRQNS